MSYPPVDTGKPLRRILLEHGAKANARDNYGTTPLHEAFSNGDMEVVDILLGYGADATFQDIYGYTPMKHRDQDALPLPPPG